MNGKNFVGRMFVGFEGNKARGVTLVIDLGKIFVACLLFFSQFLFGIENTYK
jgi:hypothetical protein